jgi:hypothetical protein
MATPVAQEDDPLIVAWMDEKHAWRTRRAPAEPGTHALMMVDDHARRVAELESELAAWKADVERLVKDDEFIDLQNKANALEASLAACRALVPKWRALCEAGEGCARCEIPDAVYDNCADELEAAARSQP